MAITRIITPAVTDDAVTLAKMAPGTDGNLITYDASGNPVAVSTGSAGQVLTSAGAGAPPTFATIAGGLSEVDYFTVNDLNINSFYDYTLTSSNVTRVSSSLNGSMTFTKTGTGVSIDSDGLVSFPSTGTYYVTSTAFFSLLSGAESNYAIAKIFGTNNGATGGLANRAWSAGAASVASSSSNYVGTMVDTYFTVGNTSNDKLTFKYSVSNSSSNVRLTGRADQQIATSFMIMKVAG